MPVQLAMAGSRPSSRVPRAVSSAARGAGTFCGRLRRARDRRFVDIDDEALAAIQDAGGKVTIIDSTGDHTTGEVKPDALRLTQWLIVADDQIHRAAAPVVAVRPRRVRR
jgi:hypothetical protein